MPSGIDSLTHGIIRVYQSLTHLQLELKLEGYMGGTHESLFQTVQRVKFMYESARFSTRVVVGHVDKPHKEAQSDMRDF